MPQCSQSGFHWNQLCPGCSDFCVDCTIFHFLVLILLDFSAALGSVGHLFFLGILYSAGFHSPFSPCTPCICLCPFGVFSSLPLIDWCFLRLHSCHPTPLSLCTISLVSSFISILFTTTAIYLRVHSPISTPNCASEFQSKIKFCTRRIYLHVSQASQHNMTRAKLACFLGSRLS